VGGSAAFLQSGPTVRDTNTENGYCIDGMDVGANTSMGADNLLAALRTQLLASVPAVALARNPNLKPTGQHREYRRLRGVVVRPGHKGPAVVCVHGKARRARSVRAFRNPIRLNGYTLEPRLDAYNVTNNDIVLGRVGTLGPSYGRASNINERPAGENRREFHVLTVL
jgi:hypothetical protein